MQNIIVYNNFAFPYTTLNVSEQAVFAEDGFTQEATRYIYTITGYIYAGYVAIGTGYPTPSYTYPDTVPGFNLLITDMQANLNQARKSLIIQTIDAANADTPTTVFTAGPATDIRWGPIPGELRLERFSGGLAAKYTWSITTTQKDCYVCAPGGLDCAINGAAGVPNYILSCIRKYDFSVDKNGMTTRTISGKITISAQAITNLVVTADSYRQQVTPLFPQNFRRIDQRFSTNEAGTEMAFIFVDEEKVYTLPNPMSDGEAIVSSKMQGFGGMINFSLSGYFEAPRDQAKGTILTQIINLFSAYTSTFTNYIPDQAELSSSVYSNRIQFSFTGHYFSAGAVATDNIETIIAAQANAMAATAIQNPPNSTGTAQQIYPYGGSGVGTGSGVGAAPIILYDACTGNLSLNPNAAYSSNAVAGDTGAPNGLTVGTSSYPVDGLSDIQSRRNPILEFFEKISYEFDSGVVIFHPKVAGAVPITQQTRNPKLIIIQAGYAKKFGQTGADAPVPNPPIRDPGTGAVAVLNSFVSPTNGEIVATGQWNLYTTHWRYVMESLLANVGTSELGVPQDPRRNTFSSSPGSSDSVLDAIANLVYSPP